MTSTAAERRTRPRIASVLLWVLQVLLAVFFLVSGISALAGSAATVHAFTDVGAGQWLRYVIGSLEVIGAIGLLIPRVTGPAAIALAVLMAGALFSEVTLIKPGSPAQPLIPLIFLLVLAWFRRDHTAWWIGRVRGGAATGT